MPIATLTTKGQVTIPKPVRDSDRGDDRYDGESLVYINDGNAGFKDLRRFGAKADDAAAVAVGAAHRQA